MVIITTELLWRGNDLVKQGLDLTAIISSFRVALKAAVAHITKEMPLHVVDLRDEHLTNAAKALMSSKVFGKDIDFFTRLAVQAVKSVRMTATVADVAGYKAIGTAGIADMGGGWRGDGAHGSRGEAAV